MNESLAGMPLSTSEIACFQCASPDRWGAMAIAFGRLVLCAKHAAVFSAAVAIKNNQIGDG